MTAPVQLTGKQLRHLRALAHPLKPIVQVGKHGWTDAVCAQIDQALIDHELIKVRLGSECPTEMDEFVELSTAALAAHLAQVIGSTAILYRAHPKKPQIKLPRGK